MKTFRASILYVILFLTFVFNVERLDVGGENVVDIQSFLYVLIALTILANIISPKFHKLSPVFQIAFWNVIYFVLKLFIFYKHPLFGNFYTYLTITEIALLSISVLLAYNLADVFAEYENIIEKVTFPKDRRVINMGEAQEVVNTEFVRSRRHNRPLSVIAVEMDPRKNKFTLERTVKIIQQAMFNRFLFTSLAKLLVEEARRTDMIIEQNENQFVLLCPETTPQGSIILSERIQNQTFDKLGITVKCGFASFPDEALTFDDLRKRAYSNLLSLEELTEKKNSGTIGSNADEATDNLNVVRADQQSKNI